MARVTPVDAPAAPFLKWAGGKRWFVEKYAHLLPPRAGLPGYREPCLGGGALFFTWAHGLRPAVLSDLNPRLMAAYLAVRDHVEELLVELERHPYERAHFDRIRERLNTEPNAPLVERAAWMFVITKHGFNGLYRENDDGAVNVTFGKPPKEGWSTRLADPENLRACSRLLQGVELRTGDLVDVLCDVAPGEFVLIDSPYEPASETAQFKNYTAAGFTFGRPPPAGQSSLFAAEDIAPIASDVYRMRAEMARLHDRGALVMLMQSDTPQNRDLFRRWRIETTRVLRSINSDTKKRGLVNELVICNFDPQGRLLAA